MELNPENECFSLKPDNTTKLKEKDSLNILFEKQASFQEKLGRLALSRRSSMKQVCDMLKDDIYNMTDAVHELMGRLPHKHWKSYSKEQINDWVDEKQRTETLFEYVDALCFFINIGLILEFMPEEIFHCYIAKNKENFKRQDNNY